MFPIPGFVSTVAGFPMRLILRKKRPERGVEVAGVVSLYLALLILASWLIRALGPPALRIGSYVHN
jgi:hypothetical protein